MSVERLLRGGCHCGRNRYIIQFPKDATAQAAQVLFHCHPSYRVSQGTPLPAYLRVPLEWYHSATFAFFPDETNSQIHKVYSPPHEQHTMRHFCGFCGTPLSYWSEEPRSEAEFIHLALGSLSPRDLADLEDLGVLPSVDDEPVMVGSADEAGRRNVGMSEIGGAAELATLDTVGRVGALPWFDALTEGSRLALLRRERGLGTNREGTVKVEWEIVEWTEDDGSTSPRNGKRKLDEVDDTTESGKLGGL
ncbi:hypothetical protein VTK56DRAFT_3483 [Thermocarpiscus australiensis]